MPKSVTQFKPGQSGNPGGRPKADREYAALLSRHGAKTLDVNGKHVSNKQLAASLFWQGVTTGQITFPDGRVMKLGPHHWIQMVTWYQEFIDGPPRQQLDIQSDNTIRIEYVNDWRNEQG